MKILAAIAIGIGIVLIVFKGQTVEEILPTPVPEELPVTILLAGDVMFDRGVRRSIENNFSNDYSALFAHTGYVKDADIAFANLEGPVATGGYKVGSIYSFRMNPAGLVAMRDAGFDIVSFANNHVGDYTTAAFNETLAHLDENNIAYTGAGTTYQDTITPRVITVRGLRIGFLAATDVGPEWMKATDAKQGILLGNDPDMATIIARAKEQCDILVMSFHWGDEYSLKNARQEKLARMVIDNGADIVVGHHPHVMQKVETYKGKPIFYSLGNFIFDQYFSPHTMRGMVGMVVINPETKEIQTDLFVSPLNRAFIPQPLKPFTEDLLITKSFTP